MTPTLTRTFCSLGAITAMALMLLARTADPVRAYASSTEAPDAHPVMAAVPDTAATAIEDLAAWPIAATR